MWAACVCSKTRRMPSALALMRPPLLSWAMMSRCRAMARDGRVSGFVHKPSVRVWGRIEIRGTPHVLVGIRNLKFGWSGVHGRPSHRSWCLASSQLDDRQLLDKIGWEGCTSLDCFQQSLRNATTDAKASVVQRCFLEFSCWGQGAVPDGPGERGSGTRLDNRNDSEEASTFGYTKCDVVRAIYHVCCGCHLLAAGRRTFPVLSAVSRIHACRPANGGGRGPAGGPSARSPPPGRA